MSTMSVACFLETLRDSQPLLHTQPSARIHTHTHTRTHTHTHTQVHAHTHAHTFKCAHTQTPSAHSGTNKHIHVEKRKSVFHKYELMVLSDDKNIIYSVYVSKSLFSVVTTVKG